MCMRVRVCVCTLLAVVIALVNLFSHFFDCGAGVAAYAAFAVIFSQVRRRLRRRHV